MKPAATRHTAPALVAILAAISLSACGQRESAAPASVSTAAALPADLQKGMLDTSLTRAAVEGLPMEPACTLENVVDLATQQPYPMSDAVYTVARDKAVKLIGFAIHKSKGEVLGAFKGYLASASAVYRFTGQTTLERPDVVDFFKAPNTLKAGFQVDIDLKDLPPADYAVFLQGPAGQTCPTHHTIRVS